MPCSPLCGGTCWGPGDDQCLTCSGDAVAIVQIQGSVAQITCADECPQATFPDAAGTCRPCDEACLQCTSADASDCDACVSLFDTTSLECVTECPPNTFEDSTPLPSGAQQLPDSPGFCLPCNPLCNGCTGPEDTDCVACRGVLLEGQCLSQCPDDTYLRDGLCLPCSSECEGGCSGPGASDCTACKHVLGSNGLCAGTCKDTEFADGDSVCRACHARCSESQPGCSGPAANDCDVCGGFVLSTAGGSQTCEAACPAGTFANAATRTCDACHAACDECTGPGVADCVSCATARFNGECVEVCPAGTFLASSATCTPCSPMCSASTQCSGPSAFDCAAPGSPAGVNPCAHVLHNTGECLASCPQGFFANANRECEPCHASCKDCGGSGASECTLCRRGQYLTGTGAGECSECHPLCSSGTCVGPTAEDCTAGCLTFTDLSDPQAPACVQACPANTYVGVSDGVDSACLPCNAQCVGGCTGATSSDCVSCAGVKSGDRCASVCPEAEAPDESGVCAPCSDECINGCTAPADASACVSCAALVEDGACVQQCSTGYPFVAGGECLASCPGDLPFYEDTRGGGSAFEAARCVSSCSQLGDATLVFVSEAVPFRCTTEAQARQDNSDLLASSDNSSASSTTILIVVVCVVAFLMVVLVVLYLRQRVSAPVPRPSSKVSADLSSLPIAQPRTRDSSVYSLEGEGGVANPTYAHHWNPTWANSLNQPNDDEAGYMTVESPAAPAHSTHV